MLGLKDDVHCEHDSSGWGMCQLRNMAGHVPATEQGWDGH